MQRDLGYKAITDGEYRRHMFYDGFFDNLEGFTYYSAHPDPHIFMDCISNVNFLNVDVPDIAAFKAEGFKGAETWLCTGKIRRVRPCYVSAFEFLAKNVPADEVKYIKMTMVFW
jgi:methionine synthase II (cobalamin-independent)